MKPMRVLAFILKMLMGILFLVSAGAKILDLDQFEIYVFSYGIFSLNASFIIARLCIVAELMLAIGLLSNLYNRVVHTATILTLIGFTLFLGYAALIGRHDSCHCMGGLIDINPVQSMLKNAVLLILMIPIQKVSEWKWRPRWFIWVPILLIPLIMVFVVSAPDNWMYPHGKEQYNQELFDSAIAPDGLLGELELTEGKKIVAFVTPQCNFCRLADKKLYAICTRHDLKTQDFVYISPSDDSTIAISAINTTLFSMPTHQMPKRKWLEITYGQRPMIFLMQDGIVKGSTHYRNINESDIVNFLQQTD